ncbi:hypothetical protein HU200_009024 [Digitaria exilis]|uniref:Uncharacterized protein n=1 Tax=Digitaria exilis TaxID=1010633 RepID=A0A835FMD3_9POAL|nr:hypothetical protein HU200_009024 [Digitaria exilis]
MKQEEKRKPRERRPLPRLRVPRPRRRRALALRDPPGDRRQGGRDPERGPRRAPPPRPQRRDQQAPPRAQPLERRIVELGGRDYSRSSNAPLMTDLDGNIVAVPNPPARGPGYRYFGAARKLPGVRELSSTSRQRRGSARTRYEIHKRINAGYYGYYDDEDGVLERLEAPAEKRMREEIVAEWHRVERVRGEGAIEGGGEWARWLPAGGRRWEAAKGRC